MKQQNPFWFTVHLPTSYPIDLTSFRTLIQGCHNRDRRALEELFSRYTRHFVRTIAKTFVGVNRKDLAGKRDILLDAEDEKIVKGISLKVFRIRKELRNKRNAGAGPPFSERYRRP